MTRDTHTRKRSREQSTAKSGSLTADTAKVDNPLGDDANGTTENSDSQDLQANLSSDIRGILAALHQVRNKAVTEGQKKNEDLLNGLAVEIKSLMEEAKRKAEKERQALVLIATNVGKEYEKCLKTESDNFRKAYEVYCVAKESHLHAYDEAVTKFEDSRNKLLIKCEQQKKKEKMAFNDLQKVCVEKITAAEHMVKRKKQDEKSFKLLKESLGSIFDSDGSDEDIM